MRAQIDIPLKFNTDLEQVYRIIEEVNNRELSKFEQITNVSILGPKTTETRTICFSCQLICNKWSTKSSLSSIFWFIPRCTKTSRYRIAIREASVS